MWKQEDLVPGEPVFVLSPWSGADAPSTEEHGVLIVVALDVKEQASRLIIM